MKYLIIYLEVKHLLNFLTQEEKGDLFDVLIKYAENEIEPVIKNKNVLNVFNFLKSKLDEQFKKAKVKAERAVENGSKGGRPPKKKVKKKVTKPTELTPNDNFQDFWTHYTPIKIKDGTSVLKGSKQDALKAYSKLIQEGISHEIIMKGLESYLTQCRVNNSYTLHAVRFLSKRLFEIEEETTVESIKPKGELTLFMEELARKEEEEKRLKTTETTFTIEN